MTLLHHLGFFNLNHWEIIMILVVVLIIFGPKSLPALGRSLGKGMREFKDASSKFTDALSDEADAEHRKETEDKDKQSPQRNLEAPRTGTPTHDLEVKDSVTASSER